MDPGKRAKIFSPFDALKGFSDAVEAKEELYVERIELPEDECTVLDKIIYRLREHLRSTDYIFGNTVTVAVTHFVPCADPYHDAYGSRGKYVKTTGTLTCIDADVRKTMTVDGKTICFADIISIGIIK